MTARSTANEIPALPPGVKLFRLDNGLVVIVREDHSAPVVSAQAWCKTGSIDEGKWLGAGLSHMLEHMLLKGTTTRPGARIDQEVQEAGGYMNAYTSFDRTVYHIDAPNTGANVAIDILCDIMQNASLPAEEMAKEKQVILREMDMNQDDPGRRSGRRLFETAYTKSPYRFTVIGYPDIYNELKPEDILAYYREKYVPNNIFYVVVGDVKPDEVVAQIKTAYEKSKAKYQVPERRSVRYALLDLNQIRQSVQVSDDMLKLQYQANIQQYQVPNQVHVQHILFMTVGKTDAEVDEIKKKAGDVLMQAKKGGKFDELARKNSKDQGSAERGGDLDWNVPSGYDRQFSEAMVRLEKGAFSDAPVRTRFGYHIIQLDDVRPVKFPALAEVRQRIQQQLVQNKVQDLIKSLRAKAKIE